MMVLDLCSYSEYTEHDGVWSFVDIYRYSERHLSYVAITVS